MIGFWLTYLYFVYHTTLSLVLPTVKSYIFFANNEQKSSDLPSLIYLYSEHLFHHQGQIPTSALLMRSYALQGYQNQGSGEPLVAASYWLLLKTIYMNWLFNDNTVAGRNVNVTALVLSGVVVGLLLCGLIALVVLWKYSTDVFGDEKGIRTSNGDINTKRKKS